MLLNGCIKPLKITEDVWLIVCCELDNDDIIQLSYCIMLTAKNLKKLDKCYNILKKSFTALGVIQLMEPITIINTPSLFNLLKAINAIFYVGFYGFDIRC